MHTTKTHRPGHASLRKGRSSEPGRIYSVTWATRRRMPVLAELKVARIVIRCLMHCDTSDWSRTLAFVVMPDHVHWLFELGDGKTLAELVETVKSYSTREANKHRIATGSLWQAGYYDRAARRDDDLVVISRYIVANPLRAGIVDDIGRYPYWDAVWLTG